MTTADLALLGVGHAFSILTGIAGQGPEREPHGG